MYTFYSTIDIISVTLLPFYSIIYPKSYSGAAHLPDYNAQRKSPIPINRKCNMYVLLTGLSVFKSTFSVKLAPRYINYVVYLQNICVVFASDTLGVPGTSPRLFLRNRYPKLINSIVLSYYLQNIQNLISVIGKLPAIYMNTPILC